MDFEKADLIIKFSHKISTLAALTLENNNIEPSAYERYDVKRGLRDANGKGVLCGLTEISEVISRAGDRPVKGELFYRGYDVKDLIKNTVEENRFGF